MGMKKESREASKREREEGEEGVPPADDGDGGGGPAKKKKKKSRKERKSKSKSKKHQLTAEDGAAVEVESDDTEAEPAPSAAASPGSEPASTPSPDATVVDPEPTTKEQRKAARAAKKAALESKVPTHDEDGIPYNKIQLRRMRRRVKHGLAPVATEEEEREIRERERRERAEEERLYATTVDDDANADAAAVDDDDDANDAAASAANDADDADDSDAKDDDVPQPKRKRHNPPSKGTKRSKPVPPDYVCQACKNQPTSPDEPVAPHWIYDCPLKKTRRGCNKVAKKLRGLHDPPSRKVFVSGLPFDCTEGGVKRFFEGASDDGTVALVHCKLLKFEDSNRCKGQAFLTFDSDDGARAALGMDGAAWKDVEAPGTKGKKPKKEGKGGERKELRLRVTKMKNRLATKRKGGKR